MDMGERIAYLRKKNGMSQAELARRARIAQSTLHGYESGFRPALGMSVDVARRLAKVFGVTVDYLCGVYDEEGIELSSVAEALV
jgi:transcriptional regulator with XRE-family HTH domain